MSKLMSCIGGNKRSLIIFVIFLLFLTYAKIYWDSRFILFTPVQKRMLFPNFFFHITERTGNKRKDIFIKNWKKVLHTRIDHNYFHRICPSFQWKKDEAIPWSERKECTDFSNGYIFSWNIHPAMEFSSIVLQTQYRNKSLKMKGGDHWRVNVKGPSNLPVMKRDLKNGSYEYSFLPLLPGVYKLYFSLEYTLCSGLKEPPPDWFKSGTVQGKEQKQGILYRDVPFINKPMWSGLPFEMVIPEKETTMKEEKEILHKACSLHQKNQCNFLWNGFGGWINKTTWKPLCSSSYEKHYGKRKASGVLWTFGDSVTTQLYHKIKKNRICRSIFKTCMYTYNWLYSLENYNHTLRRYTRKNPTTEKTSWDTNDFNVNRLLEELRQVLIHPAMNEDSVLLLNYGLHFVESVNYTNFQLLIQSVITLLGNEARCHVIWKTTSALNRHKYSRPYLHSRRFMTSQRVELYNAYATETFCNAGYDVIDIYPLTDSYPEGTGSINAPYDPVHYEYHVMNPIERLLERVFEVS